MGFSGALKAVEEAAAAEATERRLEMDYAWSIAEADKWPKGFPLPPGIARPTASPPLSSSERLRRELKALERMLGIWERGSNYAAPSPEAEAILTKHRAKALARIEEIETTLGRTNDGS